VSEKIVDIVASPEVMLKIVALAKELGVEVSAPMAVDSSSDALDAPLGVDELRQVLEVVTLIATTGTAIVGLLAAIKNLLGRSEAENKREPQVIVVETISRRKIGVVRADTQIEDLNL
jgi:hypothetical protein